MKKLVVLGLVFSMIGMFCQVNAEEHTQTIKNAIAKYKQRNFLGCISDLRMITEKDPASAVAWYYLGNAYMNIAMQSEAHEAFDKVVELNSVPKLTSYAIQAKMCMENPARCEYQDLTYNEIQKLKEDPVAFINEYLASKNAVTKSEDDIEIEKLIGGKYQGKVHPNAKEFIRQERAKMEQMNLKSDAYMPNINNALAMYIENDNQKNNYADLLRYYENQENSKNISPEMLQLMMMQNSMPNF